MTGERGEFEMAVTYVWAIPGQDLVAVGIAEPGLVRSGDQVVVIHGHECVGATCGFVERLGMIPGGGLDPLTVGLRLPGLSEGQVVAGDIIKRDAAAGTP